MDRLQFKERWTFNKSYGCWCLEDLVYTKAATNPEAQRLSIFVPAPYMTAPGVIAADGTMGRFTARTAPVIFENNSAGYREMSCEALGSFRDESEKYLACGMVYVSCGCRGMDSVDAAGMLCGKSPWTLVDLKTAIRFLRHNAAALPGDLNKLFSVGWSAGGAMSALLAVTGDDPLYDAFLAENGAEMAESDAVFAAQIYCPITDLEHADAAYEWQFHADKENEATPFNPPGTMTAFQDALSEKLAARYVDYFNSLGLCDPKSGELLMFGSDGRSGTAYACLMTRLEEAATGYLRRLTAGEPGEDFSPEDYLRGNYSRQRVRVHPSPEGMVHETIVVPGQDKRGWLRWDGKRAEITSLDAYILNHRRRMKPCTAFDALDCITPENREFGTEMRDALHFSEDIRCAAVSLRDRFPAETGELLAAYAEAQEDAMLKTRLDLINPMRYIGSGAVHYRIRTGACDADTAFTVSLMLALALENAGKDVDFAFVWDQPHCEADYPGEVCDWIEKLC